MSYSDETDAGALIGAPGLEIYDRHECLRAGETGPFILIGRSYGGLLAANFARRYPSKTAALVMADGTPPDVFRYLPDGVGPAIPAGIVRRSRSAAWMKLFAISPAWFAGAPPSPPDTGTVRLMKTIQGRLADVAPALAATRTAPDWATVSIFEEWLDPNAVADLMVYDLELGSLPVFVVTPAGKAPPKEVQAIGVSAAETDRARHFLEQAGCGMFGSHRTRS